VFSCGFYSPNYSTLKDRESLNLTDTRGNSRIRFRGKESRVSRQVGLREGGL
jgi:hypothetical protein